MKYVYNTLFLLVIMCLVALSGCGSSAAQPAAHAAPPQVTVSEVAHRPLHDWAEFTGRLEAVQTVEIRPRVSGFIDRVGFVDGAHVRQGELLFRIDPRPFKAEVERLTAARARAASQLELARSNHVRAERLIGEHAISREEFDTLSSADRVAASDLAAATAELEAARLNLEFTEVRAPIEGRVSRALITLGNLVSSTSLLATVVSDDPIYASFDVDEDTFLRFGRGAAEGAGAYPVYIGLADERDYPHPGSLKFIDNQVDHTTGTIRARAVLANPDGVFTPGLFARVRIVSRSAHDTVLINDRAVGTDLGKKFVFVLNSDSTVAYRSVILGPEVDGLRIVQQGLKPGEIIVVNGLQRARPGALVSATSTTLQFDSSGLKQLEATNESSRVAAAPLEPAGSRSLASSAFASRGAR